MSDDGVTRVCWLSSLPRRIRIHGRKVHPHAPGFFCSQVLCRSLERSGESARVDAVGLSDSLLAVMKLKYEVEMTVMTVASGQEREQIDYWRTFSVTGADRLYRFRVLHITSLQYAVNIADYSTVRCRGMWLPWM